MFSIKKKSLYALFFIGLLTTEFFYIHIGGGIARIYHFVAIFIILALIGYLPRLFASRAFVALLMFWAINIIAANLSNNPDAAMASVLSVTANIGLAVATALILVSNKFDWLSLKRLILTVTLLSILWGLLQLAAYRLAGMSLALSFEQETQILQGLSPAFRTEANTFGKYLLVPFLLFLPEYIRGGRRRKLSWIYAAFIVGILAAFTRTAIYGILLTLFFVFFWYMVRGNALLFLRKWSKVAVLAAIGLAVFASGMLSVSEYALHKIGYFFSKEEITEGSSSAFRIMNMEHMLDAFLANDKTILIGNGWGQVYMVYGDDLWQTGAGDLLAMLGYGGLLGGGAYLLFMGLGFISAMKVARSKADPHKAMFAEGIMFALLGVFITGQMSGYMIAPEFWMLIGIAIFLSVRPRKRTQFVSPAFNT